MQIIHSNITSFVFLSMPSRLNSFLMISSGCTRCQAIFHINFKWGRNLNWLRWITRDGVGGRSGYTGKHSGTNRFADTKFVFFRLGKHQVVFFLLREIKHFCGLVSDKRLSLFKWKDMFQILYDYRNFKYILFWKWMISVWL